MLRRMWDSWSFQAKLLVSILLVLSATVSASGALFYLSSASAIERIFLMRTIP